MKMPEVKSITINNPARVEQLKREGQALIKEAGSKNVLILEAKKTDRSKRFYDILEEMTSFIDVTL